MSYRIKSVAALTGITTATLRAWERRYGIVSPPRTEGGYRVYSEQDVARLIRIKSMVDRGFKVGEAVALLDQDGASEVPPLSIPADFVVEIREELLAALLALDRPRADRITERLAFLPFDRQVDELLMPLLREIGEYWEHGRGSVAQEHFVSVFAREKLIGMLEYLGSGPAGGREVVCAGAPGDLHELGLLATAIHLALAGWRVTYLGADVPLEDLETVLRERIPRVVCSSIITPRSADDCLELARRMRRGAPPETLVVLGGGGIAESVLGEPERGLHLLRGFAELFDLLTET